MCRLHLPIFSQHTAQRLYPLALVVTVVLCNLLGPLSAILSLLLSSLIAAGVRWAWAVQFSRMCCCHRMTGSPQLPQQQQQQVPVNGITSLPSSSRPRALYVDHIKAFLTMIVVIHHCLGAFNGGGLGLSVGAYRHALDPFISSVLILDQSWFMSALFFFSALLTPSSFKRKGARTFAVDKLIRLGTPFVLYFFAVGPAIQMMVDGGVRGGTISYIPQPGPPWFLFWLLMFNGAYLLVAAPAAAAVEAAEGGGGGIVSAAASSLPALFNDRTILPAAMGHLMTVGTDGMTRTTNVKASVSPPQLSLPESESDAVTVHLHDVTLPVGAASDRAGILNHSSAADVDMRGLMENASIPSTAAEAVAAAPPPPPSVTLPGVTIAVRKPPSKEGPTLPLNAPSSDMRPSLPFVSSSPPLFPYYNPSPHLPPPPLAAVPPRPALLILLCIGAAVGLLQAVELIFLPGFLMMPITIGSLPFDAMWFYAGIVAADAGWLETPLPTSSVRLSAALVVTGAVATFAGLFTLSSQGGGSLLLHSNDCGPDVAPSTGAPSTEALGSIVLLCILAGVFSVAALYAAIGWCSKYANKSINCTSFFVRTAFAVYLIHPVVVEPLTWAFIAYMRGAGGMGSAAFSGNSSSQNNFSDCIPPQALYAGCAVVTLLSLIIVYPLADIIRRMPFLSTFL